MPIHQTILLIAVMTAAVALLACNSETNSETPDTVSVTQSLEETVSPEIAGLAHRLVIAYMSDKDWGFFGATCDQWIQEDYQWRTTMSQHQPDGRVKITYQRNPDRILGPDALVFFVTVDTGEVEGDNESETGRSSVAEGCDKW